MFYNTIINPEYPEDWIKYYKETLKEMPKPHKKRKKKPKKRKKK